MEVLGMKTQKQFKKSSRRSINKGIKVVYISSPMKVKTSASEFRALVQELTGRDSDAERFIENRNSGERSETIKKDVEAIGDVYSHESHDFGFGLGFGLNLCDFLGNPNLHEFGNDSIIFN